MQPMIMLITVMARMLMLNGADAADDNYDTGCADADDYGAAAANASVQRTPSPPNHDDTTMASMFQDEHHTCNISGAPDTVRRPPA